MDSTVQHLLDRYQGLVRKREPWLPYWQQLADVLLPHKGDFTVTRMAGEQKGQAIFDSAPRLALRDLASTLDGLIKPKTANWFDLATPDPDLNRMDEVRLWLEICRELMWTAIYQKDARFIHRSGEVDTALACYGWGVLWIQENAARNGLLFRSFHNANVCIDENEDGIIDTVAVEEMMSARNAAQLYRRAGKTPGRHITDVLGLGKLEAERKFRFVQIVLPRTDQRAAGLKSRQPWVSAVVDVQGEVILFESGYNEFPAAVPRWDTSPNEVYARSPGMMALPDSQTLQAMGKTLLVGGQRAVDPPIWLASDSVVSPVRTFPGGVTVVDLSDTQGQAPIGAFPVSTNIPLGREMQLDYRRQVEAAFFKNIFNLPLETRQMTATEIIERKEEFIRVIGPVFGRLESDYIGHVVERVFGIMERALVFPPRPDVLADTRITFHFQSPIQQARKQLEIAGLSRAMQLLAPLATAQPEILDHIDGDRITRDAPEWAALPQKWLRPTDMVQQLRQQRAEAIQMQQQINAAAPVSQAIQNVAQAEAAVSR